MNKYNYVVSLWRRVSNNIHQLLLLLTLPFLVFILFYFNLFIFINSGIWLFFICGKCLIFVFSDFIYYWRVALCGCPKTAIYSRGSIQRVGLEHFFVVTISYMWWV